MRTLSALLLLTFSGCLSGCQVSGRYSIQGPFGSVSWGAEGDKPHKAEVPMEILDAIADRIRGDYCDLEPVTDANDPQGVSITVTPTGSMAVPR